MSLLPLSNEFFAFLQVQQSKHHPYDATDAEEQAVLEYRSLPDDRMNVVRQAVGVRRDVPHGVAKV